MVVWGRKHPKLLDEETRRRWRALEEGAWKHAAARGSKEKRSSNTRRNQLDSSCLAKPALRTVFDRSGLTTLGAHPRTTSPHSLLQFHFSSDSFSGLCDLASAFLKLLLDRKNRSRQPAAVGLTLGLTMGAFNL